MLDFLIILHTLMKYNREEHSLNVLGFQTTVVETKITLDKNQLNSIVVVDKNQFLGVIVKDDLFNEDHNSTLYDVRHLFRVLYLREDYSLFDYLRIISIYNMISIPVVDEDNMTLIDLINSEDILKKFHNTGLIVEGSTVLILKKFSKAFLYSEVFQIAEANAAKIFGSYINSSDEEETEIVLNIFHTGLNELLQSYRRYDYDIVSFHEEDLHHETLKANSDYFSKYLTV